jgi:Protein of unknown function (DUF3048) N-terminal domain/Protein of unknown function (DUF3048) C-terminal domain
MRSLRLVATAALAVLVVGCSSDGSANGTTAAPSSTIPAVTSVAPQPTVGDTVVDTAPSETPVDGPVYPLTGLPVTDPAAAARPALVVKIDNNAAARPQSGLNEADIVFEEIVEVQTRFAAVFHSQTADPVGPIRSGRTQDIALLGSFDKPLFAWSGGNKNVTAAIEDSDLVSLSALSGRSASGGGFYRGTQHKKPHNLYAQSTLLWTLAPADAGPPPQQFQYRAAGEPPAGDPASGATGEMDGLPIEWKYDPSTALYARSNGGVPHMDEHSGQVTTANVVVMSVHYRPSPADARSPEAQTIGTGDAMVFTGGSVVQGTWTRNDRLSPVVLTDANGSPILLTPGRTWVELARADAFTPTP